MLIIFEDQYKLKTMKSALQKLVNKVAKVIQEKNFVVIEIDLMYIFTREIVQKLH